MPSLFKTVHGKWRQFWSLHWPRQTFVIAGTLVGVTVFYWPIIQSLWTPLGSIPPEQRHLYDVKNTYYVKKRNEEAEQRKAEAEARK